MNQELPPNKNTNEEVDLIVFFNYIGTIINSIFKVIKDIIKGIFSIIIYTLKVIINSWKIILGVLIIAIILGYVAEKQSPVTYKSEMLVRPYFDSKFQLVNNISFFNALIANKDYDQLNKIFNQDSAKSVNVEDIKGFKIEPGPETENDRILQYQRFTQELDSVGLLQANYDDFIENRSIYSGDLFLITAKSNKKDIFKSLTNGINTAFTNEFSSSKKVKDSLLYDLQKKNIDSSLSEVEKLQQIYIQALQDQAKNPGQPVKFGELLLSKDTELDTKEYALLEKELGLREQLRQLDAKRINEDVFVDVISSFQPVGNKETTWKEKYSLIFPVLAMFLLALFYVIKKVVIYAKNYDE
ncbi:hypothetical protein [Lacinutrix chionoecetis]